MGVLRTGRKALGCHESDKDAEDEVDQPSAHLRLYREQSAPRSIVSRFKMQNCPNKEEAHATCQA